MVTLTVPVQPPAGPTSPSAGGTSAGSRRAARVLTPAAGETVDAAALLALTMIGIVGFHAAYGGTGYLAAGGIGTVAGLALSHLGQRARLPFLAVVASAAIVFVLSAGLVSGLVSGSVTLSLAELHRSVTTVVSGWQQLLTTGQPVGSSGGLLMLPYLLGLFSGVTGHALARRTTTTLLPAAAPAVVVALSILFGAAAPAAADLQGTGFTMLAVVWAAVRQHRAGAGLTALGHRLPWQLIAAAVVVLAFAGAGASVLAPRLPFAGARQRFVLTVVPPFDVSKYPSPLAEFRDYTKDVPASISVYGRELFAITGLPAGSTVRIAAMDAYDGYAWGVTNEAASSDTFTGYQRVGSQLPGSPSATTTAAGQPRTATITIESGYTQPWLPDLPGTTSLSFPGTAGAAVQSALRFNVATGTGIVPGGVLAGLRYAVTAAQPPDLTNAQLADASPYGAPDPAVAIPAAVTAFAAAYATAASTPLGKVVLLASYLRANGQYTDGGGRYSSVLTGHDAGRLTTFLESRPIIGDDEQYAATMALLAAAVGVPARVSLDATVEPDGTVYGRDVRADVELHLAQYGWVTLPAARFTGASKPTLRQHKVVPPAQPVRPVPPGRNDAVPLTASNESGAAARSTLGKNTPRSAPRPGIPAAVIDALRDAGIPVLAVAAIVGGLLGAKAVRRRRRRGHGPPAVRADAAWREVLDLGRDIGIKQAVHATRREQAAHAEANGIPQAAAVALAADTANFGPDAPDVAAAAAVWALADQARRAARSALPLVRRTWAALNPASLFP